MGRCARRPGRRARWPHSSSLAGGIGNPEQEGVGVGGCLSLSVCCWAGKITCGSLVARGGFLAAGCSSRQPFPKLLGGPCDGPLPRWSPAAMVPCAGRLGQDGRDLGGLRRRPPSSLRAPVLLLPACLSVPCCLTRSSCSMCAQVNGPRCARAGPGSGMRRMT